MRQTYCCWFRSGDHHRLDAQNPVNNGINLPPQLVNRRNSEPSTVWCSLAGLTKNNDNPWYTRHLILWVFFLKNNQKQPKKTRTHVIIMSETKTMSRWFKVPFSSPSWRSLNLLKGSLNHPKKVTLNHQGCMFFCVYFFVLGGGGLTLNSSFMPQVNSPLQPRYICVRFHGYRLSSVQPPNPKSSICSWLIGEKLANSFERILYGNHHCWLIYWRFRWFSLYYRFSCAHLTHPKHQRVADLHWNPGRLPSESVPDLPRPPRRLGGRSKLIWVVSQTNPSQSIVT